MKHVKLFENWHNSAFKSKVEASVYLQDLIYNIMTDLPNELSESYKGWSIDTFEYLEQTGSIMFINENEIYGTIYMSIPLLHYNGNEKEDSSLDSMYVSYQFSEYEEDIFLVNSDGEVDVGETFIKGFFKHLTGKINKDRSIISSMFIVCLRKMASIIEEFHKNPESWKKW